MKKAEYIDPLIGTVGEENTYKCHGGGKTYPGAAVPGGMVQLSPDTITGGDNGTGYNYCHKTIEGFSFNRMSGIGWYGDLGNIQIMPVVGETDLRSGSNEEVPFTKGTDGWKSPFSHENECAKAGYYSVKLDKYDIFVRATAGVRSGMLSFTYPQTDDARVIFNFSRRIGGKADFEKINIVNERRIEGTIICTPAGGGFGRGHGNITYNLYFVCELSAAPLKMRFFSNEELIDKNLNSFEHEDTGIIAFFGDTLNGPLNIRCAISYVDLEGARKNFASEHDGFDFDLMRNKAMNLWQGAFDSVEVDGYDETDLTIFYTCLYHTLLDPRTACDCDGRYVVDGTIMTDSSYTHRTVFSGWDVYRSEFPLLTLINPEMVNDEVNSLLRIAEMKNTSFPQWELLSINAGCMVGDPGLIVVADAFVKGIRNYDTDKAYEIAKASSNCEKQLFGKPFKSVRPDCEQYKVDCFVPNKLSDTLEFLLADFTMARFAQAVGKTDDARYFIDRVKRYKENYNRFLGFLVPRRKSGRFVFERGKYGDNGCVESNIYQQTWFTPYDVIGLSKLFGEKRTLKLLERFFEGADFSRLWNDDYNHSNEPCHNITHYFTMLGKPYRTQYWTRRVQKEAYRLGAFGFCGNEDVGQLSAWYVLSALGFAQLCPGYPAYFLNTPLFKSCRIKLDPKYHACKIADTFTVVCDCDPLEKLYIKSAKLNSKALNRAYLTYEEITDGGILELILSKEPCPEFGMDVSASFLSEI